VQSDPAEALDVLYLLRDKWAARADASTVFILEAIESLIGEFEAELDAPEDGQP
jgi:hypothetical protein